jgi:YVTN family beta-propeller protein
VNSEPHPGDTFAGHLIEAEIGRGGMGLVFRAHSISLDRRRAIKVIAPRLSADPAFAARFRRESRLAASVEHPNVVPVHHAGEEGGLLFIVMSFIDGVDLARVLDDGPLEAARVAAIVSGVAAGLDAAHAAGLVHRDVKPANILLAEAPDGSERVYLTDFGISKPLQPEATGDGTDATASTALTGTGQVLGTADYTAPEQIESGRADARSDIYSLACVAFQALTGKRPFHRETELATLIAHTKAPRPSATAAAPAIPPQVDALLRAGMAIDPAERPASAGEFASGLQGALLGTGASGPGTRRHRGSRSMAAAGLGLVTAVVAAVVAVLVVGGSDDVPAGEEPTVATSPPGAVGAEPVSVAVGEVRVWVASHGGNEVDRLRKGRPEKYSTPIPLATPRALAVGFESIWVVNGDALYRLNPGAGSDPMRIPVGADPGDVAVDPNFVWVSNQGDDTVMRIDPTTNKISATVSVADAPEGLATGKGSVYVADTGAGRVTRIDAQTAKVMAEQEVSPGPTSLAVATRGIWVADESASTLLRISPTTLRPIGSPIDVADRPSGVAVGLGSIWVSSAGEDEVERFDPADGGSQGEPIPVGAAPADVAIGTSAVYTANSGDATVTRIAP